VVAWKLPPHVRVVGMAIGQETVKAILFLSKLAPKSIRLDEAPLQGRSARGKAVLVLKGGDQVTGLTLPWEFERPAASEPEKLARRSSSRRAKTSRPRSEAKRK
jgi:hypothetical protein